MVLKRFFLPLCGVLLLSGCLDFSGFTMSGKSSLTKDVQITSISVDKSARRMYLLSENTIIRSYRIGLFSRSSFIAVTQSLLSTVHKF